MGDKKRKQDGEGEEDFDHGSDSDAQPKKAATSKVPLKPRPDQHQADSAIYYFA